jgi:hypothetical protein
VSSGALGMWAANVTDSVVKARLFDAIIAATILAIVSFVLLGVLDHKERSRDNVQREKTNRQVAEIHMDRFGHKETMSIGASLVVAPKPKKSLREAAMEVAKEYRDFANAVPEQYDSLQVMKDFWAAHPFRELDEMKERFKVPLGQFNVVSSAEWIPHTPEDIRSIADNLEEEALRIPHDVLQ